MSPKTAGSWESVWDGGANTPAQTVIASSRVAAFGVDRPPGLLALGRRLPAGATPGLIVPELQNGLSRGDHADADSVWASGSSSYSSEGTH